MGWFTSDNVSNNDTAMKEFARQLNADKGEDEMKWDHIEAKLGDFICRYSNLSF